MSTTSLKRHFLAGAVYLVLAVSGSGLCASGLTWFWVTLYDGGKPVQVWVTQTEPKVSGDTCRLIPQGQKYETVIHGVFSVSTHPPVDMPAREPNYHGF
jgi:hypothetical protein